jgi:hypothetical protein
MTPVVKYGEPPGLASAWRDQITKDFMITKDFRTYSIIFLRQEKFIRDHEAGWR